MRGVPDMEPLLAVEGLSVDVSIEGRAYPALRDVSFTVQRGEAHGLVGESGSGKSLALRSLMGLLPPNARVTGGRALFKGADLFADNGRKIRKIRGSGISMVFQEPAVALNPIARVGTQISDGIAQRRKLNRKEARDYAIHMMDLVGIPSPELRVDAYPFQLSGGMRQRVMIAASVACEPELILCDEPTTALDVTVQAQVLDLFAGLKAELNAGILYVTHDLAVVSELCSTISVLYAGRLVESGTAAEVLGKPEEEYTRALLAATPRIDEPGQRLQPIPGTTLALRDRPTDYSFTMRMADHALGIQTNSEEL
ncbi:ABC transporter ATP-binding protein [Paenarthrobacter sp. NPDC089316]|uniref:ABC transporter ATP-binding protein n=1 Tax=unclassified Paenarthrobacter TaxID=2634190 RepID=UPI00341DE501